MTKPASRWFTLLAEQALGAPAPFPILALVFFALLRQTPVQHE